MKFVLTYDGELPSAGNRSKKVAEKWAIRKHFHPQLEELWRVHPTLANVDLHRDIPVGNFWFTETHHSLPQTVRQQPSDGSIDLCQSIDIAGVPFRPLIRNSYLLTCGLKILFLRRGAAGRVYQGGDLDNRIKTLLDALAMPLPEHVVPEGDGDVIHCLLEDDSLVTGMTVETERLLGARDAAENEVRLIIEVDVRVSEARGYNRSFVG